MDKAKAECGEKCHKTDNWKFNEVLVKNQSLLFQVHIKTDTDLEVIKKWLIDGHRPLSSEKDLLHKIEIHYGPKDYSRKHLDIEVCG